jgi:hypothetical protein
MRWGGIRKVVKRAATIPLSGTSGTFLARADEVRALARLRRAEKVGFAELSFAFGYGATWLYEALAGRKRLTRDQVRRLRELILEIAAQREPS